MRRHALRFVRARVRGLLFAALALASACSPAAAAPAPATHVTLPALFSDHMVLQRRVRVPVWGWADPGGVVRVSIASSNASAVAGADGRWSVSVGPLAAGGPYELHVWGRDTLVLHDVLAGDVWLASGQSNMEMPVDGWGKVRDVAAEVAAADHPQIRLLQIERRVAYTPEREPRTNGWQVCSPASVRPFSATAYFFARSLQHDLGVPVGVIHASWGGTEIEAWTRAGVLANVPGLEAPLAQVAARAAAGSAESLRAQYGRASAAWNAAIPRGDRGSSATPRWSSPALDDRAWSRMTLPTDWENAGFPNLDGVVWFRRTVEIPAGWSGRELSLHLGRIDDADTTFFDGVPIGVDSVYDRPRIYSVPAQLVTPGPHVIAVRVYDWVGGGGLWGDAWMMKLAMSDRDSIALAGPWAYQIGLDFAELPPRPRDPDDPNQPGVLANGMLAPLVPYAIHGAIWYQGEANAPRAEQYRTLFPLMIQDWRRWWGAGDFPFLFVQLANFGRATTEPGASEWAELREAQAMTLRVPKTGMALAIDIGEADDIHPRNKQEVGRRLALAALAVAEGRDVEWRGPHYAGLKIDGGSATVRFDHTGGVLRAGDGAPRGFALAGADRVFHRARARLVGDTVVLTSDEVPQPVAVRYAWADNPVCDLVGGTGLPAEPFRTDDWPGVTHGRR